MKIKKTYRGALAIVGAAFLRSLDGVFLRPQLYTLSPVLVVFLEHGFGAVLFLGFLIAGYEKIRQMGRKGRGALLRVSIFGGILGTISITKAFFLAVHGSVSFATIVIIQKLQVVFALLMASLILKEKLQKSFYLRAMLALFAAYILAFGGGDMGSFDRGSSGALFALFAAFAFGSSTVFSKQLTRSLDAKRSAGMRFVTVFVLMGIYLLISKGFSDISLVSDTQWIYFVIIVFSSGGLALFLYYYGLRYIHASQATIMELARPLSAIFLDWIINGNILTPLQRGATALLLLAMVKVNKIEKLKNYHSEYSKGSEGSE